MDDFQSRFDKSSGQALETKAGVLRVLCGGGNGRRNIPRREPRGAVSELSPKALLYASRKSLHTYGKVLPLFLNFHLDDRPHLVCRLLLEKKKFLCVRLLLCQHNDFDQQLAKIAYLL